MSGGGKGGSTGSAPAGTTTTSTTSAPWSQQQPYLTAGMQQASNLYNQGGPQYYPGPTYANPTQGQLQGLQQTVESGLNGTAVQQPAIDTTNQLLGQNPSANNPSNATYNAAASGGLNTTTGGYFAPIASGQQQNTAGIPTIANAAAGNQGVLSNAANGGLANTLGLNPASGIANGTSVGQSTLNQAAQGGLQNTAGQGTLNQAASGGLNNTAGTGILSGIANGAGGALPGSDTLNWFSQGNSANASNPYFQQMAQETIANVMPQIQGQFNSGAGRLDSGLASRALGEGLGGAVGNLAYNNYQQGLQQQQSAANSLAGNALQQQGLQSTAAQALSGQGAQNIANQLGAANSLGSFGAQNIANQLTAAQQGTGNQLQAGQLLANIGQNNASNQLNAAGQVANNQLQAGGMLSNIGQNNIANQLNAAQGLTSAQQGNAGTMLSGAQGLGGNYNTGVNQQISALSQVPSLNNMVMSNLGSATTAGTAQQGINQAMINDAVQRYSAQQQQPYSNLQNYMQNISGNYGSSGTSTSPYFQNQVANGLGSALGTSALINSLGGTSGSSGLGGLLGGMGGKGGGSALAAGASDLPFLA